MKRAVSLNNLKAILFQRCEFMPTTFKYGYVEQTINWVEIP